ncbi:MAG: enoyl-CoA hydratase [bacterium TMED88]|nr:enoyl-CoA hydratase [Deltaproteobacteria bacterium]OUV28640.1 MAG: enoyl-CoA hydratase [bacterium TMED88]
MENESYRIFGVELSPYSVKVRSYFRYKQIPHEWIIRGPSEMETFQRYAKLPLIPLVVTPEDVGLQDSTPILEEMEKRYPEPSIYPADPVSRFVSTLFEEFGDEWGNKWMFHFRWAREVDQWSAARRLGAVMAPEASGDALEAIAGGIRERMINRVWFVGSSPTTAPIIERTFVRGLEILDPHLTDRPYLFGSRPALGDFGLWGQLYNAGTDPTCGELIRKHSPSIQAWIERMLTPRVEGEFEGWEALSPTLTPFLGELIGGHFLPWSDANAKAIEFNQDIFQVELAGHPYEQKPQKYHARSLAQLRQNYAAFPEKERLNPVLQTSGCLDWLQRATD